MSSGAETWHLRPGSPGSPMFYGTMSWLSCSPLLPTSPPYCSQQYLLAAQQRQLCHPKRFSGGDAGENLCYSAKGSTQAFVNSSIYSCHALL